MKSQGNQKGTAGPITSAMSVIEERRPLKDDGVATIRLKTMRSIMAIPKFTYQDEQGRRTLVRYAPGFNSIFAEMQDDAGMEIKLAHINLEKNNTITDRNLLDYLLLHPRYGKDWELVDMAKQYQKEMELADRFDDVWEKVRKLNEQKLRSLNLLLIPTVGRNVSGLDYPELKMSIRPIAEKDPEKVAKALADPILETLYMYNLAIGLKVLTYDSKTASVNWADSGKELCKIPPKSDPAKYVASQLLLEDFLPAREAIEKELYD